MKTGFVELKNLIVKWKIEIIIKWQKHWIWRLFVKHKKRGVTSEHSEWLLKRKLVILCVYVLHTGV